MGQQVEGEGERQRVGGHMGRQMKGSGEARGWGFESGFGGGERERGAHGAAGEWQRGWDTGMTGAAGAR